MNRVDPSLPIHIGNFTHRAIDTGIVYQHVNMTECRECPLCEGLRIGLQGNIKLAT